MKNRTSSRDSVRKLGQPQQTRNYPEDLSNSTEVGRDQSMEWIVVKLHTKLKNLEVKHVEFINYCVNLFTENKRILDERIFTPESKLSDITSSKLELSLEREKVQKGLEYILTVQEEIVKGIDKQEAKPNQDTFNSLSDKITEAQSQVIALCLKDAFNLNEIDIKARILDIFKQLNEAVWNQIFKFKIKGDNRLQVRDWIRKIMQLEDDKKTLLAQQKDYIDRYSSKIKDKQKNYEQEMSKLEAENNALLSNVADLKEKLSTVNQQLKNQSQNQQSIGMQKDIQKSIERRDAEPEKLALSQRVSVLGKKLATRRYQSTENRQVGENRKQSPIPTAGNTRYSTPILKDYSPMRAMRATGTASPFDRSLSPGSRNNSTRELKQLKDQLGKLKQERDSLRAWKETVESEVPTYSPPVQRTISELEAEKLSLQRRMSLLQNKTKAFVRGVRSYMSTSIRCQKALQLKDKDGIRLITRCEEEKFKLELKLKDLSQEQYELDVISLEPRPPSPTKRDMSLLQKENELLERENQRLEGMLLREREKTDTFSKSCDLYDIDFITDEKTDIDRIRRENEQLERENRSLENIIRKERERFDAIKKAFDTLEDDYNSMSEAKGKLLGLQQDFDHMRKEKECLEDLLKIERERINTVNKTLEAREKEVLNISELKGTIKTLNSEKEYLNKQLKSLEEFLKKEKERYETLRIALEAKEKDLTEISNKLSNANILIQDNVHLEQENFRLQESVRKEQEKFEILNRSFDQHQLSTSDNLKEVESLTDENDRLINDNQLLTELLKKEQELSKSLQIAYSDSRQEVKDLHNFRAQLNTLKLENQNLQNSNTSLEKLLHIQRAETDRLTAVLQNTEKEYVDLKSTLDQFHNITTENSIYKQTVSSLTETIQILQQNINSLTNSDQEKAQELQELLGIKQKYLEISKTLNQKQNQLIELNQFKEKFESLKHVIHSKDDEIEILHDSVDNAEVKIHELYEAYKILEKTNKDVCKHRDELEEANRLLEKNYKDLMKYRDSLAEEKKLLENEIMNIQHFIKGERDEKETLRKNLETNKLHAYSLDELSDKLTIVIQDKETIEKELDVLKLSYQQCIEDKCRLETNTQHIETLLRQSQDEKERMKNKQQELEEEVNKLNLIWEEDLRNQEENVKKLQGEVDRLEEENADQRRKEKDIEKHMIEEKERFRQKEILLEQKNTIWVNEKEQEKLKNGLTLRDMENTARNEIQELQALLRQAKQDLVDSETARENEKQQLQSLLTQSAQDLQIFKAEKDAETNCFKSWAVSAIDKAFLNLSSRFESIDKDLNHKEESLRSIKKKAKEGLEATLKNLVEYNQVITEQVKERENLQFTISDYENTIKSQEDIINNLKHKFIGDQFSSQGLSIETGFETSCEEHANVIIELSHSLAIKEKEYEDLNNRFYDLNRENEELTKNKEELEEYYAMYPEKQAKLKQTEEMLEHQIKVLEQTLELKTEEINSLQMNNEHLARCATTMNQTINEQSARISKLQEEFEHTIYEKSEQILKLQEELQQTNNNLNQIALCYEDSKETTDQGTDPIEEYNIIQYQIQISELEQNVNRLYIDNQLLKISKENEIDDCMRILNSQKAKINELSSNKEFITQEMLEKYQDKERENLSLKEEKQNLLVSLQSIRKSSSDQISHYEDIANKHIDEVRSLKLELQRLEESLGIHFKKDLYSSVLSLVKRLPEPAISSLPSVYPTKMKPHENDSVEIDIQIIKASVDDSEDESRSEASSNFVFPTLPSDMQAMQQELIEQMKINRHHERQIKVLKLEIDSVKRRNRRQDMLEKSNEESSLESDHMKDIVVKLARTMPIQNAEVEGCLKVLLSLIHLNPEENEDIEKARQVKPTKNTFMKMFSRKS